MGQATVLKWCTNRRQPSLDMATRIADTLGVSLDELVRRENA
ncbi:helix-turn-helix transcriptional regulator [Prevotella histicola]|nr:helix-turn-helix transcriptional regulator [Prevotella histicola]